MSVIQPFVHRCVVRTGDAAGNKNFVEVDTHEVEYAHTCEHCGEPLATLEQITFHIYEQLTERSA